MSCFNYLERLIKDGILKNMSPESLSDSALVTGYLNGQDDFLEILIQRYLKFIYNFIYAHTQDEALANDLTQETFVKAWRYLEEFDQTKSFKAWLFQIAKNNLIDWLRRKKRNNVISLDDNYSLEETISTLNQLDYLSDSMLEHTETVEQLGQIIEQLPEKYKTVMHAYYKDGRSLSEISQRFKLPLNTVKSQYRRSIILIKKILK